MFKLPAVLFRQIISKCSASIFAFLKVLYPLLLVASLVFSGASYSATSDTAANPALKQPIMLPVTLTRESVAVLLSDLSDKEVRTMLNKQLNGLAEKQQNELATSDAVTLKEGIKRLKHSFKKTAELTLNMASTLRYIAASFRQDRAGYAYLINFFSKLSICLGIAFILDYLLASYCQIWCMDQATALSD